MISLPIFRGAVSNAADVPSLDLNFSGPSGFFAEKGATPTLTRGSVATYTDSAGVLRTTNSNLMLQSSQFDSGNWVKGGLLAFGSGSTANGDVAPDGTTTADVLVESTANMSHYVYQQFTSVPGSIYTGSLYVKKYTAAPAGRWIYLYLQNGLVIYGANFDLLTGVLTSQASANTPTNTSYKVENSGAYWRISISMNFAITANSYFAFERSNSATPGYSGSEIVYAGDNTTSMTVWGAQLEQASYAGPYSPTTTVATNNGPRIDYDPVTLACKGLLIEEARTNSIPGSNDFSNATYWSTAANVTITSAAATSPDSTLNAFELKDTTSNTLHQLVTASTGFTVTTGTNYTFSFYAKKSGKRYVSTNRGQAFFGTEDYVIFDLELGIITFKAASGTATITPVGNGWYRCTHTLPAIADGTTGPSGTISLATAGTFTGRAETYIGNGTGIYIYGAQFEVGTFPTSYIPTTTATVTRNVESCYLNGTNFSSWFNSSEGTFVVDFRVGVVSPFYTTILVASDGGVLTNNIRLLHQAQIQADILSGSSVIAAAPNNAYTVDTLYKSAIAYKVNDFAFCLDSGTVTTDTSGAVPVGLNQLLLASWYTVGSNGNSNTKITISRVRYYNKRLANSRLQQRTSPTTLDWRSVGPVHWPNYKASIENSAIGATAPTTFTVGPVHGNGSSAFVGGVLTPNGKIILGPRNSTNIGIYDITTNTYSNGPIHGKGTGAFGGGGVLLPNGKIIYDPIDSLNIGIYDIITNTYTDGPVHGKGPGAFVGSVLTPTGKVILIPNASSNIGIYDPIANTYVNGPGHGRGANAFAGGVLAPNGKIILLPYNSTHIGIYDPIANTYVDGPVHGSGTTSFGGGVLTPSGKIILAPLNALNIGIYDPIANTYVNGPVHGRGSGAFIGGALTPSGKIILAPLNALNIGIYDPIANTYVDGPVHGRGSNAFHGAVSLTNGKVIFIPFATTNICIFEGGTGSFNNNVLLSAYYNKF